MELFRLIRSLPSQSPDKGGVMGELCRTIRHLGSGIYLDGESAFGSLNSPACSFLSITLRAECKRESRRRVNG
jgi:hypothetical protein